MESLRYRVTFPAPHTHYAHVTVTVPTSGAADVELMMPVWTPGSYLVREFSRHVETVAAATAGGRRLAVYKTQKNRWRVATDGAPSVVVDYRVYGREMSVRTNWIEADFALLNGAPTFLTLAGAASGGARVVHDIVIEPAAGWTRSCSGLCAGEGAHHFVAPDYDTLIDSPILIGNPAVYEFTVDGRPHALVNEGEAGVFDGARAAGDVEAIVRAHLRMWGSLPYERYVFLNVLTEAAGGLEHRNSTVLMGTRWATRTRRAYLSWLELASHEFFHVWNVKRLRPVELGPFELERENYTRSLWIAEGITEYYADLLVHRAGLSTRDEYFDALSSKIEELQSAPGRAVQSVELSSFDAWIRHYRPDENSPNVSISYYTKGTVLAFLLDARIRALTAGARSLDDVMRAALEAFGGERGFTTGEFRSLVERVAGATLDDFWTNAVEGTAELDYSAALAFFGLQFGSGTPARGTPGRAWLGAATRVDGGRLLVSQVRRGTPAFDAGLNVEDEILAVDGFRVRADQLETRLEQYAAGTRVSLLVARRDRLRRLDVMLGAEPPRTWRLEPSADATPEQRAHLAAWLAGAAGP